MKTATNRNPGYNSGESLIRFEGLLLEPLGFAGIGGQGAKTAQLQPWRMQAGTLVESVLPPITISNRNPDMAWPAGTFLSGCVLSGEYRPLSPCGYNFVMHSRVAQSGTVGGFIPRAHAVSTHLVNGIYAPDFWDVADFRSVNEDAAEFTVEKLVIDTLSNTTVAELAASFAAGRIQSTAQFTGSSPTFGKFTSNVFTFLWLADATWDPSAADGPISYLRASADTTYNLAGFAPLNPAVGYVPMYGVCCRQGGVRFIYESNHRGGQDWAFHTTQSSPLAKVLAADFDKLTSAGVDTATHPDFSDEGEPLEFGFFAAPSGISRANLPTPREVSSLAFGGTNYMSIDLTFDKFALCIAPG